MDRKEYLAKKRAQPVLCKCCNKIVTRANIVSHERSQRHILCYAYRLNNIGKIPYAFSKKSLYNL